MSPVPPTLVAAVLGSAVLVFALPRPRRPIPWSGDACLVLLIAATIGLAALGALIATSDWGAVPAVIAATAVCAMVAAWLARAPEFLPGRANDDDGDEGGGRGGGGGGPRVRKPPPSGPTLDWREFDDQRAAWESPTPAAPPREPIPA